MQRPARKNGRLAFTLVEFLAAVAILFVVLLVLISLTDMVSRIWRQTTGRIEQFREAREGFETMTRRLGLATLNTYWDYDNANSPTRYVRQSELRFLSGPNLIPGNASPTHSVFFLAPLGFAPSDPMAKGLENLLNTWGYFIEFGDDRANRPPFITDAISPPKHRFRLHELMVPTGNTTIYQFTSGIGPDGKPKNLSYSGREWFADHLTANSPSGRAARILAENIVALVILPKLAPDEDATTTKLAPGFLYDSTQSRPDPLANPKNQLPPILQVTMVALDERSAARLDDGSGTVPNLIPPGLFTEAAKYKDDLARLEEELSRRRLNYRVFTTNVRIAGAKWSTIQAN